jgi:hypothetical protein
MENLSPSQARSVLEILSKQNEFGLPPEPLFGLDMSKVKNKKLKKILKNIKLDPFGPTIEGGLNILGARLSASRDLISGDKSARINKGPFEISYGTKRYRPSITSNDEPGGKIQITYKKKF